jgi:hypothetical protein
VLVDLGSQRRRADGAAGDRVSVFIRLPERIGTRLRRRPML